MASYYSRANEKINFQKEISDMMHGFGGNPNPNAATVLLVESVVLQQLRSILQESLNLATQRGSKIITNYEIIFLMRKNILKLKRLHDYQIKLDQIDNRCAIYNFNASSETIVSGFMLEDDRDTMVKKKRRTHIDIIKEMDETKEISQIKFDVIDNMRKIRAANISEPMTFEKYKIFHKARCSSFRTSLGRSGKGYAKLEKWLNPNKELKISTSALEVLGFIAYETVAEIVDAVYLLRQDAQRKPGDPFSKFEGGYFCNPGSLQNSVYIKSGYENIAAITVPEIREVLRRYYAPTSGMNGLFYRNMGMDLPVRFIAL